MFYLICCIGFLPPYALFNLNKIRNLNPIHNFGYHLDIEDKNLKKCYYLLDVLVPQDKMKFKLKNQDIRFIKAMIGMKFATQEDKKNAEKLKDTFPLDNFTDISHVIPYKALEKLCNEENYIHAIGVLAFINYSEDARILKSLNIATSESNFQILRKLYYSNLTSTNHALRYLPMDVEMRFTKGQISSAIELCKYGVSLNLDKCFYFLYDLYFITYMKDINTGFSLMISSYSELLTLLIKDILVGGIYSIFEYLNLKRYLEKYFTVKIPNSINIHNEIVILLEKRKNKQVDWVVNDITGDSEAEFEFALGYCKYLNVEEMFNYIFKKGNNKEEIFEKTYGLTNKELYHSKLGAIGHCSNQTSSSNSNFMVNDNLELKAQSGGSSINVIADLTSSKNSNEEILKKDALKLLLEIEKLFNSCLSMSRTIGYKRFIFAFLIKVLKKIDYLAKSLNDLEKIEHVKATKPKIEIFMFNTFSNSLSFSYSYFSSSFYYQLAKIYEEGLGVKSNESLVLKYLLFGYTTDFHVLGNGSNVCFFRKIKISKQLKENVLYKSINSELKKKLESLTNEDDNCDICFEKKKTRIFYPCKHCVCCEECFLKVYFLGQCPICRGDILAYI